MGRVIPLMVTPARKRTAVAHLRKAFEMSERRACKHRLLPHDHEIRDDPGTMDLMMIPPFECQSALAWDPDRRQKGTPLIGES